MAGIGGQLDRVAAWLDAAALRQRVLAQNIANVNTPGYERRDVSFDALLEAARSGGPSPEARVFVDRDARAGADGNSVEIEREMGELMGNGLLYQTLARVASLRIQQLRTAIGGR
ncbi:MAG: flagellar biosynthesis protein FlgB [Planctomycetota bacterium]|nr:MAG: flagellar biosynthesis protein FlgB [Planctomycetota bacterium]